MGRVAMLSAILSCLASPAFALCMDGPPSTCTTPDGKKGIRQCIAGHISGCMPLDAGDPTSTGTLTPSYLVLTVVYAPPGTQGGKSSSSVSYGSGSTTGVTISSTHTFKQSYSVKVTEGVSVPEIGGGEGSLSFTYGTNAGDNQSLAIAKSATSTIQAIGPASDGIDHDHDLIYLWLDPAIKVTTSGGSVIWSVATGLENIQYVYVGWLKNPEQIPPGVRDALANAGVTQGDYSAILAHDPLATAPLAPGLRFADTGYSLPYEPPLTAADSVPTYSLALSYSSTSTSGTTSEDSYKVGMDTKDSLSIAKVITASLETSNSWEWDSTSAHSSSTGKTQSVSTVLGGPAFGYKGGTQMHVYFDTVYQTFAFSIINPSEQPVLTGNVLGRDGKPLSFQPVSVTSGSGTLHTVTDASGTYRVYGRVTGAATVTVMNARRALGVSTVRRQFDIHL